MFWTIVFAVIFAFLIIRFWPLILIGLIAVFGGSVVLIGKTIKEVKKYRINYQALREFFLSVLKLIFWIFVIIVCLFILII